MGPEPEISVVVPSHGRPLRLRWLLNALQEQTLARSRWEVIVAHDSAGPETAELLRSHPLAATGNVRVVEHAPGFGPPAANRNAGWRAARAPIIAFTDDDCRPPPEWLERALTAAQRHPGAIIQGTTLPDPREEPLLLAPHAQTNKVFPPHHGAHTCNIVYPRDVLEQLGGFDERFRFPAAEDTDLFMRAYERGTPYAPAAEVLTYHAVHPLTLVGMLRTLPRWRDIPGLVKRHPRLRRLYPLWIFWRPRHAFLPLAVVGARLTRRNPAFLALLVPWIAHALPDYGSQPRPRLRAIAELPGLALADAVEVGVLTAGSVKHRTLLL